MGADSLNQQRLTDMTSTLYILPVTGRESAYNVLLIRTERQPP